MTKIIPIILLTSTLMFAGTGLKCEEMKEMNSEQLKACVTQTDDILNDNYKQLINDPLFKSMEQNKKAFKEAQKSWLKFRDATCDLELTLGMMSTDKEGILNSCLIKTTIQRNKELEILIDERIRE